MALDSDIRVCNHSSNLRVGLITGLKMQDYEIEIDYHEIKKEFELNGEKYNAFCAINIFFDIDENEDYTGPFYEPVNVEFEISDVSLSNENEEILEEDIPEDILDKIIASIDPMRWEERMVDHYKEVR